MKRYANIKEKLFIKLEQDDSAESPREWDNIWDIYTWETDYRSPDKNPYPTFDHFLEDHFTEKQLSNLNKHRTSAREHFAALEKYFGRLGYLIAPVNRYEHGAVFYGVGTGTGWDHGVVGIAMVSYDKLKYEYSSKKVTEEVKSRALACLRGELEEYTAWANGEVYVACLMTFDGDCVDSLGGFYGYTMEEIVETYINFTQYSFDDFQLIDIDERVHRTYEVKDVIPA